jgi:hypothetical protein
MKASIKYIEHKPAEHTDRGEAWIAHVWHSSSGRTLCFNNRALKRGTSVDGNHFDLVTGESYWVSGVKKRGSNRHWAGGGPIKIEQSLVEWYQAFVQNKLCCDLAVIPDLPKPEISQFIILENTKLRSERT